MGTSLQCLKVEQKVVWPHYLLKTIAMFAFRRFYLRVLAGFKKIIRKLNQNFIWRSHNLLIVVVSQAQVLHHNIRYIIKLPPQYYVFFVDIQAFIA
jgi:hypothetical protein